MISGTLTPSSANLVQRPKKLLNEDEQENNDLRQILATTTATTSGTTTATTTQGSTTTTNEKNRSETSGRSAALERAYVHDVYENCEEPVGPIRPRVAQFLAGLDPGAIVCDVGCGNGRYLTACNPLIYTVGVDRCYRLTKVARGKGGEVALCDNLELPFRDESFDAVLSLAVVHHFATTERRVGAIRELARILRIGGRVIITVWALEQRHRRFESQDVLIPWQPPKNKNSNTSDDEDDDDFLPPYHAYTEDSTNSSRSAGDGDSSSLSSSSPGESCYSFVRRAIQKLAGGRKHPWFPDSWNSKDTKPDSSLDYEDAKDLPIELRRLEDFDDIPEPPLSAGLKSRSLGSILNPPPRQIVRSRSSVPSLGAQIPEPKPINLPPIETTRRPKLVKQKQSLCEENDFPLQDRTFNKMNNDSDTRVLLRKQSSLNEELMAESRLREKEKVRKRIQKQMSLNEAFLCRTLFTRRLQVIREGFTSKLKTSTGSLERVTKNGIVKIMQNLKGTNQNQFNTNGHGKATKQNPSRQNSTTNENTNCNGNGDGKSTNNNNNNNNNCNNNINMNSNGLDKTTTSTTNNEDQKPRRHSRESGSDSSKDSSLQSDTSIESEDSFASVIYIPRPDQTASNENSPASVKIPSVPTSPLIMPCPTPAHSPAPTRCKLQNGTGNEASRFTFEEAQIQKTNDTACSKKADSTIKTTTVTPITKPTNVIPPLVPANKTTTTSSATTKGLPLTKTKNSTKITKQVVKNLPPIPKFRKQPTFPIVRRVSAAPSVPKLMSLEIFNPETDDLDSDSSEPSSPDSIDSVISALKPSEVAPLIESATVVPSDHENDTVETVKSDSEVNTESNKKLEYMDNDKLDETFVCRQHLVDFAEKLSAQLLRELDEENSEVFIKNKENSLSDKNGKSSVRSVEDPYIKKLNGEIRDLNQLREELRERRLMLANLNSAHHYPVGSSNLNNNNNSINQTNNIIEEEDESPRNDLDADELMDDFDVDEQLDMYRTNDRALLIPEQDSFEELSSTSAEAVDSFEANNNFLTSNSSNLQHNNAINKTKNNNSPGVITGMHQRSSQSIESRQSIGSWGHSNSTASLDSPTVGGSATHHRYYHVFREGELDALINHHVASLHIVSSYYERASWCVVAEKVQVWTI